MIGLHDAWNWYETTRKQLQLFGRLGRKRWDQLHWDGTPGKDEKLKSLESEKIVTGSSFSLEHLDAGDQNRSSAFGDRRQCGLLRSLGRPDWCMTWPTSIR